MSLKGVLGNILKGFSSGVGGDPLCCRVYEISSMHRDSQSTWMYVHRWIPGSWPG